MTSTIVMVVLAILNYVEFRFSCNVKSDHREEETLALKRGC